MINGPVFKNMKSINGKFLLIVVPPVIVTTLVLIVANGMLTYRDMQREFSIAISNYAASESSALASHIWNYDTEGLEQSLDALILYPGVAGAVVYNQRNELLGEVENSELSSVPGRWNRSEHPISIRTPYKVHHIGSLTIYYHFQDIRGRLIKQFSRDSLLLLLLVLVIIVGAVVANRMIIGVPLRRLIHAVRKTDAENIHETVDWPARDEMGRSIAAYNALLENLTKKEKNISRSEAKLSSVVDELQERERALTTLLGNLPGMAYRCKNDKEWTMEFVSDGCRELTGRSPSALIDNAVVSYHELIHPDDRDAVRREVRENVKQRRSFQLAYRLILESGREKWVWEKGEGVFNKRGSLEALEGFVNDISELKQSQAFLEQARDAAEKAKRAADAANRAKSAFLANMSHELRTPMNAVLGFSQLMSRDRDLAPEHKEHLSIIQRGGEHLLNLINDVLEMSRIEAGKISLNETMFDLHRLLDDVKGMLGGRAEKKGLSLTLEHAPDVPRVVGADETKLRQVLINLIGNAIKFTSEGGVAARVERGSDSPGEPDACLLHFEIEDTGVGVAEEEMDMVFDAFARAKAGEQAQEGTGLGLTISRKFVQLMGGEIRAGGAEGKGAVFTFDIRVHVDGAAEAAGKPLCRGAASMEPGQPRYRLLIVDDNPYSRKLLTKMHEPFELDAREAENGREAVDIWREWRPHLIWMDVRMPGVSGLDAVKIIREAEKRNPGRPKTTIIAQTAGGFEEERAVVLEAGCDGFLRKPFKKSDVLDLISGHLGVRFAYEDVEVVNKAPAKNGRTSPPLSAKGVSGIPDELVRRLKQAAMDTNMDNVDGIVEEIREIKPWLAEGLAALAVDFEYGKIVEMIEGKENA